MKKNKRFNNKKLPPVIRYLPHFLAFSLLSIIIAIIVVKIILPLPFLALSDDEKALIAATTESSTAIISICLIVHQLKEEFNLTKQQRDIDEAQFILQYNQVFIENDSMSYVEYRLEMFARDELPKGEKLIVSKKKRQYFINYLVYFEGLALSILRNEIQLSRIDDLMGYRFFLIMNNPVIQEEEIMAFPDYYRGCITLYKRWKAHRESTRKSIPLKKYSLDLIWDDYSKYADGVS